jgi:hypothetical protein
VKDFPPDPVEPPELWADDPEMWALVRQTTAHSSAFCYPRPAPWLACTMCTWVKSLVAYERVGWLVPPPKPPRKPRRQRSREEILREQVKRTERELARLRRELKDVTSAPAQPSTNNACHPQRGEEGQDDAHAAP